MPATYHVTVGTFEGPFDLLLHLIARRKVDIWEVSLAQITDDYLAVLRDMDAVDLETTTEFLVVAATLVELKAARLLPDEDDPEVDQLLLEARDLLYARLLDYRVFKEAAEFLGLELDRYVGYVPRAVALEPRYAGLRPETTLPVTAAQLAEIAALALAQKPGAQVDTSHIQPVRLTVEEATGMVVDELHRAGDALTFAELIAGCRHPAEIVVFFLAVLEMYKRAWVDLEQADSFGPLAVRLDVDTVERDRAAAGALGPQVERLDSADAPGEAGR